VGNDRVGTKWYSGISSSAAWIVAAKASARRGRTIFMTGKGGGRDTTLEVASLFK
jgi:nucleoside phosphorylase